MINIAKGSEAKEWAMKKIIECFGQENVVLADKKLYINTKEDGMPIQVCVALTCPKTMVGVSSSTTPSNSAFSGGLDFESMGAATAAPEPFKPAEITAEERQTVQDLMRALGL